uniref:Codanin 1 n=1 Tax=Amphiprion percula TaxID=161767 RepID=A0A3P8SSB2_AMPPE
MAALLESLLLQKVDLKKVVDWLKNAEVGPKRLRFEGDKLSFSEPGVTVHKQEFVPFLLNFLREQSSQALTHGPATPAKTPSRPRPAPQTQGLSDRRGCRSAGGQVGSRSASRVHMAVGGQGKHGGGRGGHHSEETGRWEAGGRKSAKGGGGYGRIIEQISPPSVNQLNFNNLEDFPPVGSSPFSPAASKPTRRINPTPVSTERPHSKPKTCFTSTPFSKPTSPPSGVEALEGSMTVGSPLSLQEERELLKREKFWRISFSEYPYFHSFSQIFLTHNRNILAPMLHSHAEISNCVLLAFVRLVAHLDKCTLRLLAENERVASFSPDLRDRLTQAQDRSTAKVSLCFPFQPATDNRSNFGSDKAFHTFKKQRDIFYEVLREWEDFHKEPGWNFDAALGSRIRGMMGQLTSAGNHSHFARLFLKQLVQMCKGTRVNSSPGDTPDADLLGMLGADSLGRLKRLEERLIQPHGVAGPCPPPSFPGHQEFFRDFLQAASCCQLNQHLQDSLCQQLLQTKLQFFGSFCQDEKQRFSSVLLLARLLAKFLGLISFLPYQTSEKPSREIQETAITLRSKSVPVLDVCAVLSNSVRRRRTILTVPWLVEFLSMLDFVGPRLLCYRTALGTLLLLYRMLLGRCEEICYLNKLLMVSVLGWLFQIPVIPEDIFFTSEFTEVAQIEDSNSRTAGLDCIPLVDQQLLYTCCPFLGEFRKLLAAFVSGSTAKGGGIIRKITPTSAELKDAQAANRSQQKLQMDLEQAFFHNQPPSLRRTVEFVAERVGSNAVKHMKATLVSELVEKGEKMLRDGLTSPNSNPSKLNDAICAQLCEAGLEALSRATRFCYEKSPEAIRTLLPDETSPPVLTTSENITKRLATEKACSWLSANITGSYIAVGPRTDEELPTVSELQTLLQRVGGTLACRKVNKTYKCNKTTLLLGLLIFASIDRSLFLLCLLLVLDCVVRADALELDCLTGLQTG